MREHKAVTFMSRLCFAAFNFARKAPFMPSLEYTASLIDKGWSIALFPEGSIARTAKIRPFKSGIGLLAVELGVPIVPVKTEGLFGTLPLHAKWFKKRSKVSVKIGKPIYITKITSYDDATRQLQEAMHKL